eukprot:TRINITY_DN9764_c0_g1_i5.p1 TRINITY_DN9764_c0_g1~~TRINITY_DN9764_c0_g1_i5.p1  ORF type:complete len:141 (+),score=42.43 TRINITY_DN9764_c0_g1_i5:153-575(+)
MCIRDSFNHLLDEHQDQFKTHHFLGLFYDTLEKFARTQAVLTILDTYSAVKLSYLSTQVGYTVQQTEDLVVALILDKLVFAKIDQETATLNLHKPKAAQVLATNKFQAMRNMAQSLTAQAMAIDKASEQGRHRYHDDHHM